MKVEGNQKVSKQMHEDGKYTINNCQVCLRRILSCQWAINSMSLLLHFLSHLFTNKKWNYCMNTIKLAPRKNVLKWKVIAEANIFVHMAQMQTMVFFGE